MAAAALAALAIASFLLVQGLPSSLPAAGKAAPIPGPGSTSSFDALGILDSDHDGLSDAAENYVFGSDPAAWDTSGSGIPDGWLAAHSLDLHDPAIAARPAASPPPALLPPAYHSVWPASFQASIAEVYRFGRPASWNESAQGPFQNGLDPAQWDNNGDGIPDGYLLHFGLDPLDKNVSSLRPAGPNGLTVLDAYRHGTDPRSLDSDQDGIPDSEEIAGPLNPRYPDGPQHFPPTDPARKDTAGTGVCDGYLLHFGLDPNQASSSYADLDHDGATTLEEYTWSATQPGKHPCLGEGLDPTKMATAGLPIPDGWLIHFGLDPLDPATPSHVTQSSTTDSGPAVPAADEALLPPPVELKVIDEYRYGRPADWNESRQGPWWGGTDPTKQDTDGDGIGDARELRGYVVAATTEPGAAGPKSYLTTSDPTKADSDGDGLTDGEEAFPALRAANLPRTVTDPRRADTDFDGIPDRAELLGGLGLDPTRADSAGDFLRDGERLQILEQRAQRYATDLTYERPSLSPDVGEWMAAMPGAASLPKPLSKDAVSHLVSPLGDLDGDGIPNILDPDIDGDGLANGWEVHPALYAQSPFGAGESAAGRPGSDLLCPDTDGDRLLDGWEIKYQQLGSTGYNLDPSLSDSDGNGVPDSAENPDNDGIIWYSYVGTAANPVRHANEFVFTNFLEQQYHTDPNRFDTDHDGLADGWKAFWGQVYPTLAPADLGLLYPGAGQGLLQIPPGTPMPRLGTPQPDVAVAPDLHYTRFTLDPPALLPGERLTAQAQVADSTGSQRTVDRVEGTFRLTFAKMQAARTNPYMAGTAQSSDGDGMPDAWELLHQQVLPFTRDAQGADPGGCTNVAGPDPTIADGALDPDGDQLPNVDEARLGSDPLCRDSDLGVLEDGQEARAGLDPADPTDDHRLLDRKLDTDGDGLYDFEELTGTGAMRTLYPNANGPVRTDPDNPDTDGDGLLDGPTVPDRATMPDGYSLSSPDPVIAARTQLFLDLGIAYASDGNGHFFFLGEASQPGADPRQSDDSGTGIPAGWLVSHNLPIASSSAAYLGHYRLGIPAWWTTQADGPWWGGVDPALYDAAGLQTLQRDTDLDRDGLADSRDGKGFEDPMPAANHPNAYRTIDYARYSLTPPPAGATPSTPDLAPPVRRLLAQAFLDPRVVGPDHIDAGRSTDTSTRTTPCLVVAGLGEADRIKKGTPELLRGQVTDCNGHGLGGVTVEALLAPSDPHSSAPAQAFGAGFTDADGGFSFPVDLAIQHAVLMPAEGVVLRGQTTGWVNWTADPAAVFVGPATLQVRTYATTDGAPFRDRGVPALSSRSTPLAITVTADSVLSFQGLPSAALTGQDLAVSLLLADSGGAPLGDPVTVSMGDDVHSVTPDASDGKATVTFHLASSAAGLRTLTAQSHPDAQTQQFLQPASASAQILLRRPASLAVDPLPASVDAGGQALLHGQVLAEGAGVPAAHVYVNATGPDGRIASATADADDAGRFSVALPLPANLPRGHYPVSIEAAATSSSSAAASGDVLRVRSQPVFLSISTQAIELGKPAHVTALLLEPDGVTPLASSAVTIQLGTSQTTTQTDANGALDVTFPATGGHVGPLLQGLRFDGDADHAASHADGERIVLSPTSLTVEPGELARGGAASVPMRLLDAAGHPLSGRPLVAQWGTEPAQTLITDGSGTATLLREGSPQDALGVVLVRGEFAGSPDGSLAASHAQAAWTVSARVHLSLPQGSFDAGTAIPFGQLTDAGTGLPLVRYPMLVRLGQANATQATTDEQGRFAAVPAFPQDADPAAIQVTAEYPGGASYPADHATALIQIRSPVTLTPHLPDTLVMGRPGLATIDLRDARGLPVPDGLLNATLDGTSIGAAAVVDGASRISLTVPDDHPAGAAEILLSYAGTGTHSPRQARAIVQLVAPAVLTVKVERARAGGVAVVEVTASVAGKPLPNAPLFLQVEGLPGGLEGTTGKDGVARFQVLQGNGTLNVVARYAGTTLTSPASLSSSLAPLQPLTLREGLRIGAYVLVGVALALATGAILLYRNRRHPLAPALRRARLALQGRGTYEGQILLAYQVLEDAAIAHEILDGEAHTPRLLQEAIAPTLAPDARPSLETLITLFEQARYGTDPMGPAHRDAAVAALRRLGRHLARMATFGDAPVRGLPTGGAA